MYILLSKQRILWLILGASGLALSACSTQGQSARYGAGVNSPACCAPQNCAGTYQQQCGYIVEHYQVQHPPILQPVPCPPMGCPPIEPPIVTPPPPPVAPPPLPPLPPIAPPPPLPPVVTPPPPPPPPVVTCPPGTIPGYNGGECIPIVVPRK